MPVTGHILTLFHCFLRKSEVQFACLLFLFMLELFRVSPHISMLITNEMSNTAHKEAFAFGRSHKIARKV
jgi:hypothetical protein